MAEMDPIHRQQHRRRRPSVGHAVGAFIVEIDQRLLRNQPPVQQLVAKGDPIRGLSGEPASIELGGLTVVLPANGDQATASTVPADPSPAPPGRLVAIHIAPAAGQPMQSVETAEARAGGGLIGDRYDARTGHWSPIKRRGDWLSIIEQEEIDRLATDWGLRLGPGETRRNLTTQGIRLDSLLGKRFRIGEVVCDAIRHCEPCTYLEGLLGREIIYPLVHRAGIRVEIVSGGTIHVGDEVVPVS